MSNNSSSNGRAVFSDGPFNGVKIFSATMYQDRENLGPRITAWLADNPNYKITEVTVTQSSDEAFHCLTLTVYYWED